MPETKLTWGALREHLRKTWILYIVGILACLFGTELLWTITTPQIPPEQMVVIYLADSTSDPEPLKQIAEEMLAEAQKADQSLKKVEFQSLQYSNPETDYTGPMILMARLSVNEGDAFLASKSVMDNLVAGGTLLPLDDIVASGWLNQYDLEPYYATYEDEESGEKTTFLAGLRIDSLNALYEMGAFHNADAFLAIPANGTNLDTTLIALEKMVDSLIRWEPGQSRG